MINIMNLFCYLCVSFLVFDVFVYILKDVYKIYKQSLNGKNVAKRVCDKKCYSNVEVQKRAI
ncbi:MAG: hypothetical protein LBR30_02405 [Clostridioides sp.]|nr:hypothetical protein [Clostridioides sp.]